MAGRPGGSWGWIFRRCSHHYHFLLPSQLPLPPSVGKRSCGTCTSAHHLPPVCLHPDTLLPAGHQEGCEAVFKLTNNVSNQGGSSMEQLSLSSRDQRGRPKNGPIPIRHCTTTVLVSSAHSLPKFAHMLVGVLFILQMIGWPQKTCVQIAQKAVFRLASLVYRQN